MPAGTWIAFTVTEICQKAVDGVYAGVLRWGENANRFREDADGNLKRPVRVETGKPLVPESLLRRVQGVELAVKDGEADTVSPFNSYLLASLRCGLCGEAMHGYTSTRYKGEKKYRYRKYRCAGRVNKPGSCQLLMLSVEVLEQFVNVARSRARGSRTHRRGSSPRPQVLKTRAATGPLPLSVRF